MRADPTWLSMTLSLKFLRSFCVRTSRSASEKIPSERYATPTRLKCTSPYDDTRHPACDKGGPGKWLPWRRARPHRLGRDVRPERRRQGAASIGIEEAAAAGHVNPREVGITPTEISPGIFGVRCGAGVRIS